MQYRFLRILNITLMLLLLTNAHNGKIYKVEPIEYNFYIWIRKYLQHGGPEYIFKCDSSLLPHLLNVLCNSAAEHAKSKVQNERGNVASIFF